MIASFVRNVVHLDFEYGLVESVDRHRADFIEEAMVGKMYAKDSENLFHDCPFINSPLEKGAV